MVNVLLYGKNDCIYINGKQRFVMRISGKLFGAGARWSAVWLTIALVACSEPKPTVNLSLSDASDAAVSLADVRGKPVLVNAWATWCAPCRRELPLLEQTAAENADIAVVLINQGESAAAVGEVVREQHIEAAQVWLDQNYQTRQVLPYQGLPSTYLLDKNGTIIAHSIGEIDAKTVQEWLAKVR